MTKQQGINLTQSRVKRLLPKSLLSFVLATGCLPALLFPQCTPFVEISSRAARSWPLSRTSVSPVACRTSSALPHPLPRAGHTQAFPGLSRSFLALHPRALQLERAGQQETDHRPSDTPRLLPALALCPESILLSPQLPYHSRLRSDPASHCGLHCLLSGDFRLPESPQYLLPTLLPQHLGSWHLAVERGGPDLQGPHAWHAGSALAILRFLIVP